jgi:hypothetical protein
MDPKIFKIVFPFWIKAFVFTLIVEIPIFVFVARLGSSSRKTAPVWRSALAGAAGTCVTHPLLWFVWPLIVRDYTAYIVSGELLVAAIESFTFYLLARPITFTRAVAASFIANGVSYGLGFMLRLLGFMN